MRNLVNSYDHSAPTPVVGSQWVWEPHHPTAREIVRVTEVEWNGEEWFVCTSPGDNWNNLTRFWEACVPYTSIG